MVASQIQEQASMDLREVEAQPRDFRSLTESYYDQLYEHYGITDSIFSQNIKYYTEHPDILERIMDSVTQRLLREQSAMRKE